VTVTFSYDNNDNTTRLAFSDSTPQIDRKYDADGNLIAQNDGANKTTFYYDALNRLTAKITTTAVSAPGSPSDQQRAPNAFESPWGIPWTVLEANSGELVGRHAAAAKKP
jgi:YD repeat-containing protein